MRIFVGQATRHELWRPDFPERMQLLHFRADGRDCLDDVVGAFCIEGLMRSLESSVEANAKWLVLVGKRTRRQVDILPGGAEFLVHRVDGLLGDTEIADFPARCLELTHQFGNNKMSQARFGADGRYRRIGCAVDELLRRLRRG